MNRVLAILALSLAGMGVAYADGIPTVQDPLNSAKAPWTVTVYNNSSSDIQSGEVVVWDTSSGTKLTGSLIPYANTTTTADDIWTAGVVYGNICRAKSACDIVVFGPALVRCMDSSDAVGINTTVGSATTTGQCGDYTPAANKRSLGTALTAGAGTDYSYIEIFVNTIGAPAEQ